MDSWPLWSRDGFIYFVSDREGKGQTNIWRVGEAGGDAEQVTRFTSGDVRFPGISGDGKTIVFEHDFGIWKLDLASRQVKPIPLEIAAETQETLTEFKDFNSTVDDYDLAPDGKRIVLSVHGELFTAPTDEGELRQLTEGAARDLDVQYSPDGKSIAFISDQSGREEIHVIAADGAGPARKVTDLDTLKTSFVWSPDSKSIAFVTSDRKLFTIGVDGKNLKELASSQLRPDRQPGLVAGRQADRLLQDRRLPLQRHLPDPQQRRRGEEDHVRLGRARPIPASPPTAPRSTSSAARGRRAARRGRSSQIFCVPLEKLTRDPDEPDQRPDGSPAEPGPEMRRAMMAPGASRPRRPRSTGPG